jgi:hypothetical protein
VSTCFPDDENLVFIWLYCHFKLLHLIETLDLKVLNILESQFLLQYRQHLPFVPSFVTVVHIPNVPSLVISETDDLIQSLRLSSLLLIVCSFF